MNKTRNTIESEKKTVSIMIKMFCKENHSSDTLCAECSNLLDYALTRIDGCRWKKDKPNCSDCLSHCYKKDMREKIKSVMRYSGPRMPFLHPIIAIKHLIRHVFKGAKK